MRQDISSAPRNVTVNAAGSCGAGAAVALTLTGASWGILTNHSAGAMRLRLGSNAYLAATGITVAAGQNSPLVSLQGLSAVSVQNDAGAAGNYNWTAWN